MKRKEKKNQETTTRKTGAPLVASAISQVIPCGDLTWHSGKSCEITPVALLLVLGPGTPGPAIGKRSEMGRGWKDELETTRETWFHITFHCLQTSPVDERIPSEEAGACYWAEQSLRSQGNQRKMQLPVAAEELSASGYSPINRVTWELSVWALVEPGVLAYNAKCAKGNKMFHFLPSTSAQSTTCDHCSIRSAERRTGSQQL